LLDVFGRIPPAVVAAASNATTTNAVIVDGLSWKSLFPALSILAIGLRESSL
jgi:hypothetical protein